MADMADVALQDGMAGVCDGQADTISPADFGSIPAGGTATLLPLECLEVCALEIQQALRHTKSPPHRLERTVAPTVSLASSGSDQSTATGNLTVAPNELDETPASLWPANQVAGTKNFVDALLTRMSNEEKAQLLHGDGKTAPYEGNVPANARLQIPSLRLNDGPQGWNAGTDGGHGFFGGPRRTSTQFPAALTVASSWDKRLLVKWASAIASECANQCCILLITPAVSHSFGHA
jgi:hypothetical protein